MDRKSEVVDTLFGDFTSIRLQDEDLIFIDQSTNRIVAKVYWAAVELVKDGDIWKGDV